MCIADEEEAGVSTTGVSDGGSIEEILVTAPRLGIDLDTYQMIDWDEVSKMALIGATGGLLTGGGLWGALITGAAAAAGAIESQEGVDLEDLPEIKYDMIVVPELGQYYFVAY